MAAAPQHDPTAERVARNNHAFRAANNGIDEAARSLDADFQVPFICECADASCTELVRLALPEYEQIRAHEFWFLNAPGHQKAAGPHISVVEEREGYVVVEKVGEAAEIVRELEHGDSALR
jgi:hypothetical protein